MPSFPPERTLLLYFSSIFAIALTYGPTHLNIITGIVKTDCTPFTGEAFEETLPRLSSCFVSKTAEYVVEINRLRTNKPPSQLLILLAS